MPIIVHCREFHEEAERQDKNAEGRKNRKRPSEDEMGMRLVEENTTAKFLGRESPTRVWSSKDATSGRPGGLSLSPDSVGEVSRSESSRTETVAVASRSSRVCVSDNLQVNPAESRVNKRTRDEKRHSTTMELNATTTLKTDADGVPTISFSFLRAGENFHENDDENDDEIVILEVDTSDQADLSGNQLYDFPKSAILESNRVSLERPGRDKDRIISGESSLPAARQDPYDRDVPKLTCKDVSWNESREEEVPTISNTDLENDQKNYQVANAIVSHEKKNQQRDRMKRSTRSLKSGRRSYGASDSDGYDAGIASMSGSYSDPECPHGAGGVEAALSESGGSDRGKRLRFQKRRLGKAWGRMRSWLREEKTRIGQVVNRHAKLQAVGALNPEVRSNRATPVRTSKSKQRGFYDLTRAHSQESGSITRVEEFGLSSVSEEVNVSDDIERPTSASPDSGNTSANDARRLRGNLRRKTASSDDILENNRTRLQLPGSFSMDKLCSRVTENDEMTVTTATATAPTPAVTMAMAGTSGDAEASRDHGGKSGLIKRRMLGSIRGLMASTHLLQTYESDEVLCALVVSFSHYQDH
ncbi:uncharacterized protein Nost isoform X2 [Temnothorax nylanderi]